MKAVGERFADAGNEFDRFDGAHAADRAGNGSKNGELSLPAGRVFRIETPKARRLARDHRGDLVFHVIHGTLDNRFSCFKGCSIHREAFDEQRRAIHDQVGLGDDLVDILFRDVRVVRDEI